MAGNRPSSGEGFSPSPDWDFETPEPNPRPAPTSFVLQTVMELQRAHGSLTNSVDALRKSHENFSDKLDTIGGIRVDIKEVCTKLSYLEAEQKESRAKIEKVHHWVIGASAVIAFLVIGMQIAFRFWPTSSPSVVMATPMHTAPPSTAPQATLPQR